MFKEPVINVYIPYEPEKRLGRAYNRIMRESDHEWNLLLDWDTLILNPNWYDICQAAILYFEKSAKRVGAIGAVTNAMPCCISEDHFGESPQVCHDCPKTDSIGHHIKYAHYLHEKHRGTVQEVLWPLPLGGFFMLTNKTTWAAVGGFRDEYECDIEYCWRLHENGFKQYIIPGLYVYHATGADRLHGWPSFGG